MHNSHNLPFFFIIGRPRTGTTLVRNIFDAHPNVNIPIESPFIVSLHGKFKNIKTWDENSLSEFYDTLFDYKYFKEWPIDWEALKSAILKMTGEHTYEELIKVVYSHFNSPFNKDEVTLLGDKNPYFTLYIRKLAKMFPEARFIFIHRDYRDHFYSMTRVDFEADIPALIGWRWKYYVKSTRRFMDRCAGRCMEVKYEEFVQDPQRYLRDFSRFLNIEYIPEVINAKPQKEVSNAFIRTEMDKNHESLKKPLNTTRIGLWKEKLTDQQVKDLDCTVGKWGKELGYEKKFKTSPGTWLRTRPMVLYGHIMYQMIYFGDRLPYNLKIKLLDRMSFFLKFYQKRKK